MEKKRIALPPIPSQWNALQGKLLERIHVLRMRMMKKITVDNQEKVKAEFKLKVFLMLGGFKVLHRTFRKEDGAYIYIIRRKGLKYLLKRERLPMESFQIHQWIEHFLAFLDDLHQLTGLPYEYITRKDRKFKCPETLMVNVTYEQYGNAQRFLVEYWETMQQVEEILRREVKRKEKKELKALCAKADECKAGFLSTMLCASSIQTHVTDESGTYKSNRTVWIYNSLQAEENARFFRGKQCNVLFEIMVQYVQSCLGYYKEAFPDLFTNYKGNNDKDYLVMESDNINGIKKYAGFRNYQDIYNSNMFFIFGVMNNMCKEAKAVEEMNRKIKHR